MRVGIGYDVHRLVEGRALILGGVKIEHPTGLLGHSDADVLVHAIIDALLGAAALGDIGQLFPDSDEEYKDISSIKMLERVGWYLMDHGYRIENIDSIIIAQEPVLAPYVREMENNISMALRIRGRKVNVKATTEEYMGFTGTKEGMAAQATCCIKR